MARSASIVGLAGKLEVEALSMLGPSPPWTGQVAGAEHNRGVSWPDKSPDRPAVKSDSVPHSLSPRMWVTMKDFLADPTQWPLGCVLFGHSLSLSETALQADGA